MHVVFPIILNSYWIISLLYRHLSSKNFAHLGKTVQLLLRQVQKYVYDYNMGKMGQGSTNFDPSTADYLCFDPASYKNYEWNFPGLRKNVAGNMAENIEDEMKSADQDGIKELVLLQQRTVLQVRVSLIRLECFIFINL